MNAAEETELAEAVIIQNKTCWPSSKYTVETHVSGFARAIRGFSRKVVEQVIEEMNLMDRMGAMSPGQVHAACKVAAARHKYDEPSFEAPTQQATTRDTVRDAVSKMYASRVMRKFLPALGALSEKTLASLKDEIARIAPGFDAEYVVLSAKLPGPEPVHAHTKEWAALWAGFDAEWSKYEAQQDNTHEEQSW